MSGITQAFTGEVWLDGIGVRLPALVGTELTAPENYHALPLLSAAVVPVTYLAGVLFPILSIPLAVTANWFQPAILNAMLGLPDRPDVILSSHLGWVGQPRTLSDADLGSFGSLTIWNGAMAWRLFGIKCCCLSVGLSQGEFVGARLEFGASSIAQVPWTRTATPFAQAPARSQNCAHNFAVNPTGWQLLIRQPLKPNIRNTPAPPPPGGYRTPYAINVGALSAVVQATFQAHHGIPSNFVDGTPFRFVVVPPGGAATALQVTNPLVHQRYQMRFEPGRQRKTLAFTCRTTKAGLAPLLIYTP